MSSPRQSITFSGNRPFLRPKNLLSSNIVCVLATIQINPNHERSIKQFKECLEETCQKHSNFSVKLPDSYYFNFEILPTKVKLRSSFDSKIVIYPSSMVYCARLRENDSRFLYLVVKQKTYPASQEKRRYPNLSCLVLRAMPKYYLNHMNHSDLALKVGAHCTPDSVTGECQRFSRTLLDLSKNINSIIDSMEVSTSDAKIDLFKDEDEDPLSFKMPVLPMKGATNSRISSVGLIQKLFKKSEDNLTKSMMDVSTESVSTLNSSVVYSQNAKTAKKQEITFQEVLQKKEHLTNFLSFLKSEYSEENLSFYFALKKWKDLWTNEKTRRTNLLKETRVMFDRFFSTTALESLNVDWKASDYVRRHIDDPVADMFDQAEEEVLRLMQYDSFPRFIKSKFFLNKEEAKKRNFLDQSLIGSLSFSKLFPIEFSSDKENRRKSHSHFSLYKAVYKRNSYTWEGQEVGDGYLSSTCAMLQNDY